DQILFGQLAQDANGIARVSANGGTPETFIRVQNNEVAHGPQMLPAGDAVLFTLGTIPAGNFNASDVWDKAKIVVQRLPSGERKTLIEGGSDARYIPSGHIVYAAGEKLFAVPFDPKRFELTGKPVEVLSSVARAGATATAQFTFSDTGTLI